ncbi:hypothetical protein VP01_3417g1, partial [Puccinia sorghi]
VVWVTGSSVHGSSPDLLESLATSNSLKSPLSSDRWSKTLLSVMMPIISACLDPSLMRSFKCLALVLALFQNYKPMSLNTSRLSHKQEDSGLSFKDTFKISFAQELKPTIVNHIILTRTAKEIAQLPAADGGWGYTCTATRFLGEEGCMGMVIFEA